MSNPDTIFEVFMAVKIQVKVFWVVLMCGVVGYQCFVWQFCLHLKGEDEDGGSMVLHNVGILPQHYTATQLWRPWLQQILFTEILFNL